MLAYRTTQCGLSNQWAIPTGLRDRTSRYSGERLTICGVYIAQRLGLDRGSCGDREAMGVMSLCERNGGRGGGDDECRDASTVSLATARPRPDHAKPLCWRQVLAIACSAFALCVGCVSTPTSELVHTRKCGLTSTNTCNLA